MSTFILRALWILVSVSLAQPAWNQIAEAQDIARNNPAAQSRPQPYVVEFTITSVKTLANGTTLTEEFTEVQERDSRGRTLTAISKVPESSEEPLTTRVRVSDPANRVSSTWDYEGKFASLTRRLMSAPGHSSCLPPPPGNVSAGLTSAGQASVDSSPPGGASASERARAHANVNTTIEQLGTQPIQGLEARGTRITQTTLAPGINNNQPVVSTRESWQANVNGIALTLREVDDDLQNGKRTTELVKFSLAEPDLASFEPPEGFEISNQKTPQLSCQQPLQPPL